MHAGCVVGCALLAAPRENFFLQFVIALVAPQVSLRNDHRASWKILICTRCTCNRRMCLCRDLRAANRPAAALLGENVEESCRFSLPLPSLVLFTNSSANNTALMSPEFSAKSSHERRCSEMRSRRASPARNSLTETLAHCVTAELKATRVG